MSSKTLDASPIPNFFENPIYGKHQRDFLNTDVYPRIIINLFKLNLQIKSINSEYINLASLLSNHNALISLFMEPKSSDKLNLSLLDSILLRSYS